jgi:hypothetical protein
MTYCQFATADKALTEGVLREALSLNKELRAQMGFNPPAQLLYPANHDLWR